MRKKENEKERGTHTVLGYRLLVLTRKKGEKKKKKKENEKEKEKHGSK